MKCCNHDDRNQRISQRDGTGRTNSRRQRLRPAAEAGIVPVKPHPVPSPPPNLSNSLEPGDRVPGAEDSALCLPAEAVWEFTRRPRCGKLPRRVAIALPTDGEWAVALGCVWPLTRSTRRSRFRADNGKTRPPGLLNLNYPFSCVRGYL